MVSTERMREIAKISQGIKKVRTVPGSIFSLLNKGKYSIKALDKAEARAKLVFAKELANELGCDIVRKDGEGTPD